MCNTLNDSSNKVCVPYKTEDLKMFLIRLQWKNESKFLTKDISCKCKYKFDGRKCNSNQMWNNNKCWWWSKNIYVKKIIFGILLHVASIGS